MPTSRILLLGQAPGRGGDPRRPLVGGVTGARLQFLTGIITMRRYCKTFDMQNLLATYPGPSGSGKGDAFPRRAARAAALALEPSLYGRRVVFVGQGVADAFRIEYDLFTMYTMSLGERPDAFYHYGVIPHPSPVNRFWNDTENWRRARRFFDELLGGMDGRIRAVGRLDSAGLELQEPGGGGGVRPPREGTAAVV